MISFDPTRPDFKPYGFTCVQWAPSPMRRPDHHNEVELNFLRSGWVTYLLGGRKVRVAAGRLAAFWAAIPHQIIDYSKGQEEYFVATIPFAWFLQCKLPDKLVQPLLRGEMMCEPRTDRALFDADTFGRWEKDLAATAVDRNRLVLLEMEARLLRLALTLPELTNTKTRSRAVLNDGGLNKVERMACFIAQHYLDKLTVEVIGQSVNLHPNYAMSLFQKTFGTTLIDYLTHHRISHAQRLLATTDQKIVEVAFGSGFSSISRFNEAFRRECACSPREYRQQHQLHQLPRR